MSQKLIQVEPVDRRDTKDGVLQYRYRYNDTHIEDIDEELEVPDGVDVKVEDGVLEWQYENRTKVYVKDGKALVEDGSKITDAQNQAYFCLSFLASLGYVSGFAQR